jgi:hypothetical protein
MKTVFIAPIALVFAIVIPQASVQAQPYQGPNIQYPTPGYGPGPERREEWREEHERRERCERLEYREHELRDRLERVGWGEERERLEYQLRGTHEELREQCRR